MQVFESDQSQWSHGSHIEKQQTNLGNLNIKYLHYQSTNQKSKYFTNNFKKFGIIQSYFDRMNL